jgi:hypothetical protein
VPCARAVAGIAGEGERHLDRMPSSTSSVPSNIWLTLNYLASPLGERRTPIAGRESKNLFARLPRERFPSKSRSFQQMRLFLITFYCFHLALEWMNALDGNIHRWHHNISHIILIIYRAPYGQRRRHGRVQRCISRK